MIKMILVILSTLQAAVIVSSGIALHQLHKVFRHASAPIGNKRAKDTTMPSVTVCIPARNEDHALTDCLHAVLASTYEKLEIIVLDDNSVDNTSVLIKSFAHAGVRFVEGSSLPEGWLGKNHALQGLLSEASGSYVLFMDVDTRIQPHTIEALVSDAVSKGTEMTAVLPRRADGVRASVIFSPLRYFWEVLFDRKGSPASASALWLVNRRKLLDYGGFATLRQRTKPETHLAAYFTAHDKYVFFAGNKALGVSYEKRWRSQLETSIRLLAPQLNRSWAHTVLACFGLLLIVSPLFIALFSTGLLQLLSVVAAVGVATVYTYYAHKVWDRAWLFALFVWPMTYIQEAILIATSYIRHKTGRVTWKGRLLSAKKN